MTKPSKRKRDKAESLELAGSPTHLLHRSLQLALELHAAAGGPSSLTQRQHTLLAAAARGDQTQNDLVRATGIDRSTLAELVARMLARGLLERQRSATDGRAKTVRLSDAGRAALEISEPAGRAADARLLGFLPAKKRAGFVKALGTLAAAADGAPPPSGKPAKKPRKKRAEDKAPTPKPKSEKKKKPKKAGPAKNISASA